MMIRPRTIPTLLAMLALSLGLVFAGSTARATDLTDMTDAERAAFGAEVRAYLLENPELLLELINILDQRQADAKSQADKALISDNAEAIFEDGYSWVGGNPDGDVTLVEFFDYRCSFCRRAKPEVERLLAEDGNIRLVMKEFPILGDASVTMSRFAIATRLVAGNDAYASVHDALMNFSAEPSEVALRRLAEGLGLDGDAILARMNDAEVNREIGLNHALSQRLQISGTPTFVLQDEMLRGFVPYDEMAAIIAQKRQR